MSSNDDIKAGRTTTAESTTFLVGALPSEKDVGFNGTAILTVVPQSGELEPLQPIAGIFARGGQSLGPNKGGTGIVGEGAPDNGIGVHALGGRGGIGLRSQGGDGGRASSTSLSKDPGPGVVATGGTFVTQFANKTHRTPQGPGVVASAGGTAAPTDDEAANIGVFGQGGDAIEETVSDGVPASFIIGPEHAGVGVIGRGGTKRGNNGVPNAAVVNLGGGAAGVVGVAGGADVPRPWEMQEAGVIGHSRSEASGVLGRSRTGAGVLGESTGGRGGVFSSSHAPQLQLQPHPSDEPKKLGRPGDFLVILTKDERGTEIATLWFCKSVSPSGPSWVPVA